MEVKQNKGLTLFILTIGAFINPFMGASVNVALPAIGKEFGLDAVSLSWVSTAFILTTAAMLLPFGRLSDIKGRVNIFKKGLLLFLASSLLCGLSVNGYMLIVARILQGIGSSMVFSNASAIVVSVFPPQDRGRVLGINVAAVYTGLSAGPFLGGIMVQLLGWRSLFLLNVALGIVMIVLVYKYFTEEWKEAESESFDLPGSLLYGASLIFSMYGFSKLTQPAGAYFLIAGVIGFIAFYRYERTVKTPVFDVNQFMANKAFSFSNIAALINYSATFAVTFLLNFYFQYIKGFSPIETGTILVAQPIVMAVFSPLAGKLSDKIEPRVVASIGMAVSALGLLPLIWITPETSELYIIICLVLLGFGFALFSSPNTNAVMSSVEKKYLGVAASTLSTMRTVGQMMSMGIAMLLFSFFIGQAQLSTANGAQLMQSIRIAFILFSALCWLGVLPSLARGKVR